MKKTFLITILIAFTTVISFAQSAQAITSNKSLMPYSEFKWLTSESINLGKIEKGKPVKTTFEFINTGNAPLIISSVKAQCGCTGVEYSQQAIAPNEKGFVKVTYNAANIGTFEKSITLSANTTDKEVQLQIRGIVN